MKIYSETVSTLRLCCPMIVEMKIDELAYRQFLQHFLKNEKFVRMGGGLCINPEAGEIFYLTRAEKRRALESPWKRLTARSPLSPEPGHLQPKRQWRRPRTARCLASTAFLSRRRAVRRTSRRVGTQTIIPEIWLDQIIAQDRAVDLPIVTHPVGGAKPPFHPGLPLGATLKICNEVKNIVGWKMTYMYDGFGLVANGLRGLDRHVAVMGALASRFHEYKATGMFDGTLSGFWNFALDPMLDHLEAWDNKDIDKAREIWDGGLSQLQEYVADMGRLHIRYKTAAWLRGLIPSPFMRAPMPKPQQVEIDGILSSIAAA